MMAVSVMAEGRMKFKGIEMKGTPEEFCEQLLTKGFNLIGDYQNVKVLNGDFAGYNNCRVSVVSSDNEVVRVNVTFPERRNWSPLYDDYKSIKKMLTTKYGRPKVDKEEWQGYKGKPNEDKECMHELYMDRAKIFSEFKAENGYIELQITSTSLGGMVTISYFDNESQERLKKNAIEDL